MSERHERAPKIRAAVEPVGDKGVKGLLQLNFLGQFLVQEKVEPQISGKVSD